MSILAIKALTYTPFKVSEARKVIAETKLLGNTRVEDWLDRSTIQTKYKIIQENENLLKPKIGRKYDLRTHSIRKFFRTQLAALGIPAD